MYARIKNIASIIYDQGIRNVVISPGSRNAPLTISFVEHSGFNITTVYDERSAAFIALGKATATNMATVLICTSGTASVNYYPAICEAFYQETPLIVLTADRPQELIDQGDGQSIRQKNIFHNHILKSYELLPDYGNDASYELLQQVINDACLVSNNTYKQGPVHVNIPFREPFYPEDKDYSKNPEPYRVIEKTDSSIKKIDRKLKAELQQDLSNFSKILIFKGQESLDTKLTKYASEVAIAKDVMGMGCVTDKFITQHDFLFLKKENLPELVITLGKNILSKGMKTAFRNHNISHWHVGTEETAKDVFQHLTKHISCTPQYFMTALEFGSEEYRNSLFLREEKLRNVSNDFLKQKTDTEFSFLDTVVEKLPKNTTIHVSNSMPIRYLNHLQYKLNKHDIFCNRGTSGIDGSTSTAIGIQSMDDKDHYLITGDLSFFYDRNALWNGIDKSRFKIILLNNSGGGIFDIINGPSSQKIDKKHFTTPQPLNALNTARDFKMDYCLVKNQKDLKAVWKDFVKTDCNEGKILEITSNMDLNTTYYKEYLKALKNDI